MTVARSLALVLFSIMPGWQATAEKKASHYIIEKATVEMQPALVKRVQVRSTEISEVLGEIITSIDQFVTSHANVITGAPFARYHSYDPEGMVDLQAGIRIQSLCGWEKRNTCGKNLRNVTR